MRDPGAAAGAHHRLDRGDEAACRDLQLDLSVLAIVDVRLAVGDHQHLGAGQLLLKQGAQRSGRPFDLDALGVTALDIELAQQRLDLAVEAAVVSARDGRGQPEIFDLRLDRAPPAAQQSKHDRRGEKAKADRNSDQRQGEIEAGFPSPVVDKIEVMQKYDMSLFLAGGDREHTHEIAP